MTPEDLIACALAVIFAGLLVAALVLSIQTAKTLRRTYRTMTGTALTLARLAERQGRVADATKQRQNAQEFARNAIGWQFGRKTKVAALLAEKERAA